MHASFLLEIGVEELPAIPFLKELPHIKNKFLAILEQYRLSCECEFFYTPRRLVLLSSAFPKKQQAQLQECFGPPLSVAYDDGKPTKAALAFFDKYELDASHTLTTTKNGKVVLYCKKAMPCQDSKDLLETIIHQWLQSLHFGKTMRWGMEEESFIRPIRSIIALLDNQIIPLCCYGVHSSNQSHGHSLLFQSITIVDAKQYQSQLAKHSVILDQNKRKAIILEQIKQIEQAHSIEVEIDPHLLDEVIAITEYPRAIYGEFDQALLELPPPVIITSMKIHQRYFATYKNNSLHHGFIIITNSLSNELEPIIQGNKKVLHSRLKDALFFYHNDLKNGLNPDLLKQISFLEGLGSMWDKSAREAQIIQILSKMLKEPLLNANKDIDFDSLQALLGQAAHLSKADLATEMVYEFTELQGIMGYFYATALGYPPLLAQGIKEQYLPDAEHSPLPSNLFSAMLALAYKFDNLFSLFSIQKIPSGSKDPFALRRAALGIVKIFCHFQLDCNLKTLLLAIQPLYKPFDLDRLEHFIIEKIETLLPLNPSIIRAILASQETSIYQIILKAKALHEALQSQDKALLTQTFKRVANITKDITPNQTLSINKEQLIASEEIELFAALIDYETKASKLNYQEQLTSLLGLHPLLNRFFDKVLVHAPNQELKQNRIHLIGRIYRAFLAIADIKEISI